MKVELDIPDYDGNAMDVIWEHKSYLSLERHDNQIMLKANYNALLSLAKQMIYMVVNHIDDGCHVHYDSFFVQNSKDLLELIVEITSA